MARKSKIDPDLKVELVERYLCGGLTLREAARISGLSVTSFVNWIAIYRNEGRAGLLVQKHNKRYPAELKLAAVCAYLDGEGSQAVIAARYGLRSKHQLQEWIKQYNKHGEIKTHRS